MSSEDWKLKLGVMDWSVYVSWKLISWNPTRHSAIRRWSFGEVIRIRYGLKGGALTSGIGAPIKVIRELASPLCSHQSEDKRGSHQSATQKRASTKNQPCLHPDLRHPASKTVRNKFLSISHQSVVCYINPNWLWNSYFQWNVSREKIIFKSLKEVSQVD